MKNIIGDIHNIVDGMQADKAKALLQPFGTGSHLDTFDSNAAIARTGLRCIDTNAHALGRRIVYGEIIHRRTTSSYRSKALAIGAIKIGTKAPQAAGKIHSDFERGFIKAEVVNYQDLLDCGSYAGAREKGLVRMEGKDYVVQDGDVILFRFNV